MYLLSPQESLKSPQKVLRKSPKRLQNSSGIKSSESVQKVLQKVFRMSSESPPKVPKKSSEIPRKIFEKSLKNAQTVLRKSSESPQKVVFQIRNILVLVYSSLIQFKKSLIQSIIVYSSIFHPISAYSSLLQTNFFLP